MSRRERIEKLIKKLKDQGVNIDWASRFIPREG